MTKSDPSNSITATKTAFLTSQTRLLSAPLQLSPQYRSTLYSSDSPLSSKAISDITSKVNEKIRAHNRLVFSQQSVRHVAEQIETLYWNETKEGLREEDDDEEEEEEERSGVDYVGVEKDVDLGEIAGLDDMLPAELAKILLSDHPHQIRFDNEDAQKYAELRRELLALAKKRDEMREKLARYQRLKDLLRPLENAQRNIQPNLVTKDGEMSQELDRMRVLLARVGARMGEHEAEGMQRHANVRVKSFDQRLGELMELG